VRILTDIQGIEDFLGDMGLQGGRNRKGHHRLQMDMKCPVWR